MKKLNIYKKVVLPACIAVVGLLSSCSAFDDFLTVYPTNQITGEQFWEDKSDLESVLFACYTQLTNSAMAERMFVWGEYRSDNFDLATTSNDDLVNLMNANLLSTNAWLNWASVYKEIGYCNLVLSKGDEIVAKDNSFNEGDWKPIRAELKTLRALAYFYLVRAFRDVPLNTTSSDTSEGARDAAPATPSEQILTFLINDLEGIKDDGMDSYGNDVDNKGRITKPAIYTLLADLYLWRASKDGSSDSIRVYGSQYKDDYKKCIDYCSYVIEAMNYKMNQEGQDHYGKLDTRYPELPLIQVEMQGGMKDTPYNEVFGTKNSLESIFEVQYSSSSTYNANVNYFFGGYSSGGIYSGAVLKRSSIFEEVSLDEPDASTISFYKTDIRLGQSFFYKSTTSGQTIPENIAKYTVKDISVEYPSDLTNKGPFTYGSYRSRNSIDANWIVYRASDVILMKAEAMCGYYSNDDQEELEEAFNLANATFRRSNPQLQESLALNFDNYNTKTNLLEFIFRERQREFYAEGKRWFDMVRMALKDGSTSSVLSLLAPKFSGGGNAIKAKMATMNSLYLPYYKNEMKVNPALVQNPAWEDNDSSERN